MNNNNMNTIEACRYCFMCRHVCGSSLISCKESDTPRGRAILLYSIYRGGKKYTPDIIESIYNCLLCGCCLGWCEGREEGGYNMPDLIQAARFDIVNKGLEPPIVKKMKEFLVNHDNLYGININEAFTYNIKESKSQVLVYLGSEVNFKNKEIAHAANGIFKKLGIDFSFMKNELNSGKELLILGFKQEAKRKMNDLFNRIKKSKCRLLVTTDPLAYDAFKNDYPEMGFNLEPDIQVQHISQFVLNYIKEKKIVIKKFNEKVTLVDSEYLGTFNGVFEEPREIITTSAGSNFIEMIWNREKSLATGEAAFVFNGSYFQQGKKLIEYICAELHNMKIKNVIVLSAKAKRYIKECFTFNVYDITEFISNML
ncbi:MAG: (Fe-S)-binding protein [Actinobacteria bacterium]|nr:(Fe-S)-binding protein [Actinomycetota bacterium]